MVNKSLAFSWSRIILSQVVQHPTKTPLQISRNISNFRRFSLQEIPKRSFPGAARYCTFSPNMLPKIIDEILEEVERDRQREREQRIRAGLDTTDIDNEEHEDYMGVGPIIERMEKRNLRETPDMYGYDEPTDSDSEDDERFTPQALKAKFEKLQKKGKRHQELIDKFIASDKMEETYALMKKIDKFEEKHFPILPEHRVMGELLDRLKVAEGKEKFILQQKLNRTLRLVEWKELNDPNNPDNYGVLQKAEASSSAGLLEESKSAKEKQEDIEEADDIKAADDEEEFDDMKERDNIILEKLNAIDKKLEEKLAELDHTFGKKGKVLEQEIRDLAEERNELTEKKRIPLYRKGFDVKLINVKRTCKVTKGGQVVKYTAILACGNYHGVIGYAKAKGSAAPIALQKAHEKCFQNLHYVERHEEHTIAHAVQGKFKKTKIYLWPARTCKGMKAGKTVQTVLCLAGYKNITAKIIGSRNPLNTLKALFMALNAIETPKDIQEKFGRTVVEKYLLR